MNLALKNQFVPKNTEVNWLDSIGCLRKNGYFGSALKTGVAILEVDDAMEVIEPL